MSTSRIRIALSSAALASALLVAPFTAQAACDGGACPITGGSLRTMVGGGFVIPQVVSPGTGPVGQMSWMNTAMGAILPTPSAMVTVPSGQTAAPFSIDIPIGQMTYGSAPSTTTGGRFATPVLVQVPLFPFAPALFGVSTNIGQSFPGDVRTFMNGTTTQTLGGPAHLEASGRPGAATLTICPGNIVPDPIPATWTGSGSGHRNGIRST